MSRLPEDIISVLSQLAPIFYARVWPQAQTLLLGALLPLFFMLVSGRRRRRCCSVRCWHRANVR